jgi:EmrB/QacA subfamily drug resistance transporter
MGAAPAFGPTFSGWIVDSLGWKYVFHIIVPLAILELLFGVAFLRNLRTGESHPMDWISVLLSTTGFGGLLFGFSTAGSAGWGAPQTLVPIAAGAAILYFFTQRQLHSDEPLLRLAVLKNPVFSCAVVLQMLCSVGVVVGMVITPIFLQTVMGKSALVSGLTVMPASILLMVMNPLSGVLFDRFGPRKLCIIGSALLTAGTALMSFIDVDTPLSYIVFIYTFRIAGMAMVNMPLNTWGINALPGRFIAHGNAISQTAVQVANSIGTAVLVTIMMMVADSHPAGGVVAMARGVNAAFRFAAVLTCVCLVATIFKVDRIKINGATWQEEL